MKHMNRFPSTICLAFILPLFYWTYLAAHSSMIMRYDATEYESLAKMIDQKGWEEYLRTGPHREPLYPGIISIAMRLADFLGTPYQTIQKFIQILFLLITQFLTCKLLTKLKIHPTLSAFILLYLGFSPAIVNSAFSLYSEIITYPLILGIVLLNVQAWKYIHSPHSAGVALLALSLGILFILIASVKAIFELILPLSMLGYYLLAVHSCIRGHKKILIHTILFLTIIFSTFHTWIFYYKSINLKYNGHFITIDRGPWAIYGNAERRTQKLKVKDYLAALTYVAGENVCKNIFGDSAWVFWSFRSSDDFGQAKRDELINSGTPRSEIDSKLISLTARKIFEHPGQYGILMAIESLKMFFWESTKIGYVEYPLWMQHLFDTTIFKNGLRLLVFLGSFLSCCCLIQYIASNRSGLFEKETSDGTLNLFFLIFILLLSYIGIHSFFFILPRYALPIAPLFLVVIAFSIQKTCKIKDYVYA